LMSFHGTPTELHPWFRSLPISQSVDRWRLSEESQVQATREQSGAVKAGGRARRSMPDKILERGARHARGDENGDGNTTPTGHAEMERTITGRGAGQAGLYRLSVNLPSRWDSPEQLSLTYSTEQGGTDSTTARLKESASEVLGVLAALPPGSPRKMRQARKGAISSPPPLGQARMQLQRGRRRGYRDVAPFARWTAAEAEPNSHHRPKVARRRTHPGPDDQKGLADLRVLPLFAPSISPPGLNGPVKGVGKG
jgi:hypothetical protein